MRHMLSGQSFFHAPLLTIPATMLAMAGLLSSCSDWERPEEASEAEASSPAATETPQKAAPLTEQERESIADFGRRTAAASRDGDREFLIRLFNFEAVLKRAGKDIDLPSEFKVGLLTGLENGREQGANNLMAGTLSFIAVREHDEGPSVLFRMQVDGGLDYLDYFVERDTPEDDWQVVEAYTFSAGTNMSGLIRSMIVPLLAQQDRSLLEKVLSRNDDTDFLDTMTKIREISQLVNSGQSEEALKMWHSLTTDAKKTKLPKLLRIGAASTLDHTDGFDERYAEALEDFEAAFPDDPALALHLIDYHIINGDFDEAHTTVAKLKQQVNDDPYLDFYHSYIYFHEENYDAAEKAARKGTSIIPASTEPWEILLEIAFADKRHTLLAEALTVLELDFGEDYGGVLEAEEYADFRNSPEGRAWRKSRSDQPDPATPQAH